MEVYLGKHCFHFWGSKWNEVRSSLEQILTHNLIRIILQLQTTCELVDFLMSTDSSFEVENDEIRFEDL